MLRMSGGSGKAPADEKADAPAEDTFPKEGEPGYAAYKKHMEESRAALMFGFLDLLATAFPERYGEAYADVYNTAVEQFSQLLADIKYVSGYKFTALCTDEPATYKERKQAFDVFGETHKMDVEPCICFHGSSYASVTKIHANGFNPALCTAEGAYGGGPEKPCAYVSQYLSDALVYAQIDEIDTLWVVYGRAHLGNPSEVPIGSKGQTDFGVHADGRPIITLKNESASYWCLSDPQRQFISNGFMGFRIASELSDFALLHMTYPPAVWKRMTEELPELVAYKQGLVAKEKRAKHKARRHAAWAAQVGSRQQPPRSAKRKQGE